MYTRTSESWKTGSDENQLGSHILIAVDGSEQSKWAVKVGGDLARRFGGRVMLLHVAVPETSLIKAPRTQELLGAAKRAAGRQLMESSHCLLPPDVECDFVQRDGLAADEIVAAANQFAANLIVMGTRGRGGVMQFLLGSTAELVVRLAPCPVLTVGHEPARPVPRSTTSAPEWLGVEGQAINASR
jgi:nucleotide-binding universal stress UspA family protein